METFFTHTLSEDGSRTLKVLRKMGWLDSKGELVLPIPLLQKVMQALHTNQIQYLVH